MTIWPVFQNPVAVVSYMLVAFVDHITSQEIRLEMEEDNDLVKTVSTSMYVAIHLYPKDS